MRLLKTSLLIFLTALSSAAPIPQRFTDDDLAKALSQNARVLFYSFSPRMPLSVQGLKELSAATADLHARAVFLMDTQVTETDVKSLVSVEILSEIRIQGSQVLEEAGIQLHYPSLLVGDGGRLVGSPIPGFKTRSGYVSLVSDLLKLPWEETFRDTQTIDVPRPMSYFFRPLYRADFIISGWANPNYLLNVGTGRTVDIVNDDWGDPGASPDGEFITLLGGRGLAWFSVDDVLAGKSKVLLKDPGLTTYQSMGALPSSAGSDAGTVYRVVGAVSSSSNPTGLIFRDYKKSIGPDGGKTITPLAGWQPLCEGKRIAIPMIGKTGRYLSGLNEGTLKVFRIGSNAVECEPVFDSKRVTGKADFSVDDRSLVFISKVDDPVKKRMVDAVFLADLVGRRLRPIYFASERGSLSFPGFMTQDRIAVHEGDSAGRGAFVTGRLRILERSRRLQ